MNTRAKVGKVRVPLSLLTNSKEHQTGVQPKLQWWGPVAEVGSSMRFSSEKSKVEWAQRGKYYITNVVSIQSTYRGTSFNFKNVNHCFSFQGLGMDHYNYG